jgi:hypothetical protein
MQPIGELWCASEHKGRRAGGAWLAKLAPWEQADANGRRWVRMDRIVAYVHLPRRLTDIVNDEGFVASGVADGVTWHEVKTRSGHRIEGGRVVGFAMFDDPAIAVEPMPEQLIVTCSHFQHRLELDRMTLVSMVAEFQRSGKRVRVSLPNSP